MTQNELDREQLLKRYRHQQHILNSLYPKQVVELSELSLDSEEDIKRWIGWIEDEYHSKHEIIDILLRYHRQR